MAFGVFISYNHLDNRIANELSSCLVALSESLRVFIDHVKIAPGEDYDKKIAESINDSQWFIMINPGTPSSEKDMGWCIYEAGQFRNRLTSQAMPDKAIVEKMCVVYDVSIPSQTSRYHAIRVQDRVNDEVLNLSADSTGIENTPVFQLFTTILERSGDKPIRDTSDAEVRRLIRDQARRFIKAFLTEQRDARLAEVPLQPRISLILSAPPPGGLSLVDPATEVTGWEKALADIFGITGEKTTWGKVTSVFRLPSGADALWIEDVEQALISVAADRVPTQTNMLCHAKNGSLFRPVVARYFPFVSRRREVFILFVQVPRRSLVPREARSVAVAMLPKEQVLLISLLFAFRFRQQILPLAEAANAMPAVDSQKLKPVLVRIEREIIAIENEAEEYGFNLSAEDSDRPQIAEVLSNDLDRVLVQDVTAKWAVLRRNLVGLLSDLRNPQTSTSAADVSGEVIAGLVAMKDANKQFTEAIVREFAKSANLKI